MRNNGNIAIKKSLIHVRNSLISQKLENISYFNNLPHNPKIFFKILKKTKLILF